MLGLLGCLFPAELGKLLEELEGLEGLRLRKRQPIKEAIAAAARKVPRGALGMDALTTEHYEGTRPARHFKRFKGLKPGKRQA